MRLPDGPVLLQAVLPECDPFHPLVVCTQRLSFEQIYQLSTDPTMCSHLVWRALRAIARKVGEAWGFPTGPDELLLLSHVIWTIEDPDDPRDPRG